MTLDQYLGAGLPTYEQSKDYALLMPDSLKATLDAAQEAAPNARHRVVPFQLSSGMWMLRAAMLTEVGEGGLFASGFAHLDPQLFSQVEVVPMAEALALLPQAEETEE
jgi:hypothetical protein